MTCLQTLLTPERELACADLDVNQLLQRPLNKPSTVREKKEDIFVPTLLLKDSKNLGQ